MLEPRRRMGCSLIGPALWRGREGGKLEREETDTGGRRGKGDRTTGLLSAWLHVFKAVVYAVVYRSRHVILVTVLLWHNFSLLILYV